MNPSEVTLEKIVEDFSKTIFWNNYRAWPKTDAEPELPLVVRKGDATNLEPGVGFVVQFESGELVMQVAALPPLSPPEDDGSDFANTTAKDDAHFIAMLPVYIPWLLTQAHRASQVAELIEEHIPESSRPRREEFNVG